MDEEKLNISIRKFLKNVGITSQRNIENKRINKIKFFLFLSTNEMNLPLRSKLEEITANAIINR